MLSESQIASIESGAASPLSFGSYAGDQVKDRLIYCAWWSLYSQASERYKKHPEESRDWYIRPGEYIKVNEIHIKTLKTFYEVLEYLETQYAIQKVST